MSALTNTTIVGQATKNVKSTLEAQLSIKDGDGKTIIDPRRDKRDETKEPMFRITEARRKVYYPHVAISSLILGGTTLSLKGDSLRYDILCNIKVISNNTEDLDVIAGQILEVMRVARAALKVFGMNRPKDHVPSVGDVTVRGATKNIKERTLGYRFIYYAQ